MPGFGRVANLLIAVACITHHAAAQAQLPDLAGGFVTVGDPGNQAYQRDGFHILPVVGRGSVDYAFSITRTQISTGEYLEFLNTFSRTSDELDSVLQPIAWAGIRNVFYNGPGGTYFLNSRDPLAEKRPAAVRRDAALMYANWMHNGKSSDPASLLRGAYNFDPVTGAAPKTHAPGARFRLATLDEYLKAMYYKPADETSDAQWFTHRHGTDAPPIPGLPSNGGETPWGADRDELEGAFISGSSFFTPVDAYEDVQSPWGLYGLYAGRGEILGEREVIRVNGGSTSIGEQTWLFPSNSSTFSIALPDITLAGIDHGGFRIVAVPAPTTLALVVGGAYTYTRRRK